MLKFFRCNNACKCGISDECSHGSLHEENELCSHDCDQKRNSSCEPEITVEVGYEKNMHDGGPESAHYGTEHEHMHAGLLIKKKRYDGHTVEMFLRTPCGTYDECVPEILEELLEMISKRR